MTWIALGGLAMVLALAGLRVFAQASVGTVKTALVWSAGAIGAVLLAALLFTGRGLQAIWSLTFFAPLLIQFWRSWRTARTFSRGGRATPGQESRVATATLEMALHHDSGRMSGRVTRGDFAGAELADLSLEQLRALLADCVQQDPESVPLLEAWLDRTHPEWREAPQAPREAPLDRAEALAVLGLGDGATEEEIRAAHRRLMRAAHPDHGGSAWMAARVNAARDVLLSGR